MAQNSKKSQSCCQWQWFKITSTFPRTQCKWAPLEYGGIISVQLTVCSNCVTLSREYGQNFSGIFPATCGNYVTKKFEALLQGKNSPTFEQSVTNKLSCAYMALYILACTSLIKSFTCFSLRCGDWMQNMFALSGSYQVFSITHLRTEDLYHEFKQLKLY